MSPLNSGLFIADSFYSGEFHLKRWSRSKRQKERDFVMDHKGFSLLELLIVVAIILIIATIALPSLLRSRQSANETAAVASLKTLNTAEINYSSATQDVFGTLAQLVGAGLLDTSMTGTKSGYRYSITLSANGRDFTAFAAAANTNQGRYDYYTVPDYVIRYTTDSTRAPANMSGLPVQQ
jgi:prepilin-type N-terminal cleavage/methylation domain-containing protein